MSLNETSRAFMPEDTAAMLEKSAAPAPGTRAQGAEAVTPARPHVVIIGAGFGGLSAAHALRRAPVDVTVIDKRNYHLFQPLLYQVATAGLSPAQIASPIRSILRHQRNATVVMGKVTGVDKDARAIVVGGAPVGDAPVADGARRIPYDYLIVATGARHAYFGHDEWEPFAPGLKKIEDATDIRHRILIAFEKAETESDAKERERLLTFVVIGGGPTGVEIAGAIAELARNALAKDFRNIDPRQARIILVEAGPRILTAFPENLSAAAERALKRLGAEVRLGAAVASVTADQLVAGGQRIDTRTVLWGAGVAASPAAEWLGAAKDRAGRVIVNDDLTIAGHPEIFVIGDTAAMKDPKGQPVPGIAPAAKQAGVYAADVIRARIAGRRARGAFRYRHAGNLATIGRKSAVVDFGWLRLRGNPAWWFWSIVHIFFLIGFRNRITVALDWMWSYITFQRGSRLITGKGVED